MSERDMVLARRTSPGEVFDFVSERGILPPYLLTPPRLGPI